MQHSRPFFEGPFNYDDFVSQHNHYLRRSADQREVLLMWRGKVPITAMDVVHPHIGVFVEPFPRALCELYNRRHIVLLGNILRPSIRNDRRSIVNLFDTAAEMCQWLAS